MSDILFSTLDPRLQSIILHRARYINHIQSRHPLIGIEAIRETVEEPDYIAIDVNSDLIENYYAQGLMENDPDAFLKVCVLFKAEQGRVITAFGVDRPKITEELIWQK